MISESIRSKKMIWGVSRTFWFGDPLGLVRRFWRTPPGGTVRCGSELTQNVEDHRLNTIQAYLQQVAPEMTIVEFTTSAQNEEPL